MRDLLSDYARLTTAGRPVGRAVVTSVWGSAPRPTGSAMLATADGAIAGSVSGGCVEGATAVEIVEAMSRHSPKLVAFGVSDERAWEVGLACGGTIRVFIEPEVHPEVLAAARGPGGEVVATIIEGAGLGSSARIFEDGRFNGDLGKVSVSSVREAALAALRHEASTTTTAGTAEGQATVFLEVYPREPRLVIFGGVHVAVELVPLAKALGYRTIVADGRGTFLSRERFPDADELVLAWPDEAFARIGLDRSCYVCVLSHDPKFDEPALLAALQSPAPYVGVIGSRKTQTARRDWLRSQGLSDEAVARLRGPIGLDLGGRHPAETALSILAEMTAVRYGGSAARS
ncbi:MAG: XdhC family protein [Gemmatimonadales bacterium]